MTPLAAAGIGSIAAVIMYAVAMLLERLEIDDVVGAVPVHLAAGIWGTLAVAIFGDPEQAGAPELGPLGTVWSFRPPASARLSLWAFGVGFHPVMADQPSGFRCASIPRANSVGLNVVRAWRQHGDSRSPDRDGRSTPGRRLFATGQRSSRIPRSVRSHSSTTVFFADITAEQRQREAVTEALRQTNRVASNCCSEAASAANRAKSVEDAIQHLLGASICDIWRLVR